MFGPSGYLTELLEVFLASLVRVDHVPRDIAGAGVGVPSVEQLGVTGEAVLRELALLRQKRHAFRRDDLCRHVIGELRQVDVVRVAVHVEARAFHHLDQVLLHASLRLRARRMRFLRDDSKMLSELFRLRDLFELRLAAELAGHAFGPESGGCFFLGRRRCGQHEDGNTTDEEQHREGAKDLHEGSPAEVEGLLGTPPTGVGADEWLAGGYSISPRASSQARSIASGKTWSKKLPDIASDASAARAGLRSIDAIVVSRSSPRSAAAPAC